MCGHSLGATGVQEAIHCLLMLEHDFIAPSINVEEPGPRGRGTPLVTSSNRQRRHPHRDDEQLRFWRHQRNAGIPGSELSVGDNRSL